VASDWSLYGAFCGSCAFGVAILALGGHRTNDPTIGYESAYAQSGSRLCQVFESVVTTVRSLQMVGKVSRSGGIISCNSIRAQQ
jgi:hypothetical protein